MTTEIIRQTVCGPGPSAAQIKEWLDDGRAEALDGCIIEPDGTCPHGSPSWLIELGLI